MYLCVCLCACFSVHVPCVCRCPCRAEGGPVFPESEVAESSEPPHGFWEPNLGPLNLVTEPISLAPTISSKGDLLAAREIVQCLGTLALVDDEFSSQHPRGGSQPTEL